MYGQRADYRFHMFKNTLKKQAINNISNNSNKQNFRNSSYHPPELVHTKCKNCNFKTTKKAYSSGLMYYGNQLQTDLLE